MFGYKVVDKKIAIDEKTAPAIRYLFEEYANGKPLKQILKELNDKDKSLSRLVSKRVISPIELNDEKIKLLEQKIDYENNKTTATAILYGIQTLTMNEGNSDGK